MKGFLQFLVLLLGLLLLLQSGATPTEEARDDIVSPKRLEMFVDDLPIMPTIRGYTMTDGVAHPRTLRIGMYKKMWRFHRDLPKTWVFAYGKSRRSATVPGPTVEARQGITTRVTWSNHLPCSHILSWDQTIPSAEVPNPPGGVPTVTHLHGSIAHPVSDGNPNAWYTAGYRTTGPTWSQRTYTYPNVQEPGNLWYHDHAMGLTRVNLLAGLLGAYVIRNPAVESPLRLPSGPTFDRHLVVFDRTFLKNGSIYLNATGNNPSIHPQWQPEYFGDVIIVNGKAWPILRVHRRRYRLRILNGSNARFFRFSLSNGLKFIHVGSDSMYLSSPRSTHRFLLAPSEIADVVVDFSDSTDDEVILRNNAPYPYPNGNPTDDCCKHIMKFAIAKRKVLDTSRIPKKLLEYPKPRKVERGRQRRYIAMYEYKSEVTMEPTHLYLNGRPFEAPATEMPSVGTTEAWQVINLTEDNHPLHVHLALMSVLEQRELKDVKVLKACMMRENNASKCSVEAHVVGKKKKVKSHEKGWKNVFKIKPGFMTTILVHFAVPGRNGSSKPYPFDASDEPGYVYHCHILDHEDNEMMRPLKMVK